MNAMLFDTSYTASSSCEPARHEELSDDALMRALSYDHADWAIEQLYMRYKQYMYSLAYRILHDSYLAEDVIQEVLLTLWHKAALYQENLGSLKSWLQTIVRNRALDKVRSSVYREQQFTHLDMVAGLEIVSHEPELWQVVWGDEQTSCLRRALATLPAEQRQAIELNYFAGYSHAEIASQLRLPVGTVKGRIRLGLQRIKHLLQAYGLEPHI